MNWEIIRIGIDILTVLMFIIFVIVLYIAHKAYKRVSQPLNTVKGFFGSFDKPSNNNTKEMYLTKLD